MLGSHSAAAAVGEITHFPKNLALDTECTCGAQVSACPVWGEVVVRLERQPDFKAIRNNPYLLDLGYIMASNVVDPAHQTAFYSVRRRLVYGLAYAWLRWNLPLCKPFVDRIDRAARNKLAFLQLASEVLGRDLLIDSSKHYMEAISFYRAAPDQARIIVLTRDGRAVFYSGLKRGRSRKASLRAWRRAYSRGLPIIDKRVPAEHVLRISYERLTADPVGELEKVCLFLDVPFEQRMLDFGAQTHHVTNGNKMRFSRDSTIRVDSAWRDRLSEEDRRYFEVRAGAYNRALGYS